MGVAQALTVLASQFVNLVVKATVPVETADLDHVMILVTSLVVASTETILNWRRKFPMVSEEPRKAHCTPELSKPNTPSDKLLKSASLIFCTAAKPSSAKKTARIRSPPQAAPRKP